MLLDELRRVLAASPVPSDAYSLDGQLVHDAYVLDHDGRSWLLFFYERGERRNERRFDTEAEAVEALRQRLARDFRTSLEPAEGP